MIESIKLLTYNTQIIQINRALENDPTNPGLLKLKDVLEKMITIAKEELEAEQAVLSTSEPSSFSEELKMPPMQSNSEPVIMEADTTSDDIYTPEYASDAVGFAAQPSECHLFFEVSQTQVGITDARKPSRCVSSDELISNATTESSRPKKTVACLPSAASTSFGPQDEFEIPLEESLKAVEEFITREKALAGWQVGDTCFAFWICTGQYYKAKIEEIFSDGQINVIFDTYDVRLKTNYKSICKFAGKKWTIDEAPVKENLVNHSMQDRKQVMNEKKKRLVKRHPSHKQFILLTKRISRQRKKRLKAKNNCQLSHSVLTCAT